MHSLCVCVCVCCASTAYCVCVGVWPITVRLYRFPTKNKTPWCFALRQQILGQAGLSPTRVLTLMKQPCVSMCVRMCVCLLCGHTPSLAVSFLHKILTFQSISLSPLLLLWLLHHLLISPSFLSLTYHIIPCPYNSCISIILSMYECMLHSSEQIYI